MKNNLKKLLALLIVALVVLPLGACEAENDLPNDSSNAETVEKETDSKKERVLYEDDDFKISFVDFKDLQPSLTSYYLYLKIENNSDEAVVVSPTDGYANNEAVFLGSGTPVVVAAGKMATGVFIVGYGNTSIQDIDDVKTLELKLTLYNENWSEKLLETDTLTITFE